MQFSLISYLHLSSPQLPKEDFSHEFAQQENQYKSLDVQNLVGKECGKYHMLIVVIHSLKTIIFHTFSQANTNISTNEKTDISKVSSC